MIGWKAHVYRVGPERGELDVPPVDAEVPTFRKNIEPWLSAVFQSEHLSLLLGSGFTAGLAAKAGTTAASMEQCPFPDTLAHKSEVEEHAKESATRCGRGKPNIEDRLRVANQLLAGLSVTEDPGAAVWKTALHKALLAFLKSILKTERNVHECLQKPEYEKVGNTLVSFLLSFASRAASRDRLNLFTTNYDRLIEYGCDHAGLRVVDRFVGALTPVFRSSRVNVDLHYNPPGIRGEPRYLEGVIRLAKLHGSVDWRFENGALRRYGIPFGAPEDHPDVPKEPLDSVMIYPNAAKDVETSDYPYAELFRDFSAALCRPNSSLVTYGYGFGDDHVNRVLGDMLTIPSTHIVIISWDQAEKRIQRFCEKHGHEAQVSLLIGDHFGDIGMLVEHYLPKPAVDPITWRWAELLKRRGVVRDEETKPSKPGEVAPCAETDEEGVADDDAD